MPLLRLGDVRSIGARKVTLPDWGVIKSQFKIILLVAGVKVGTAQLQGWKDIAGDWKTFAEEQKTAASERAKEDAAYAARWQAAANKSSAVTERCFALVDKLQGPVPSTNQPWEK